MTLPLLLSSKVRAEIFRLLFGLNRLELHVREIARQAGRNEASVRQELKKLRKLQLVEERRDGNRVYFRANEGHPLYPEIHRLVLKNWTVDNEVEQRSESNLVLGPFLAIVENLAFWENAEKIVKPRIEDHDVGSVGAIMFTPEFMQAGNGVRLGSAVKDFGVYSFRSQ